MTARRVKSAVELIGDTPMVELSRLTKGLDGRVLAKVEFLQPGFSKKDRVAKEMIEEAEKIGELRPGQTVVELTSGNTGTGLAIVCAVKGYPFVAVMSKGNTVERARMMAALGAEVVLVEQLPGSRVGQVSGGDLALVEERAKKIVKERGAFRADQFQLWGNWLAHYRHTGPELYEQSGRSVDAFCDFVGTGGSFGGIAKFLKERNPAIGCYVVEPAGAAVLAGDPVRDPKHRIQGGGYSMPNLKFIDKALVDGYIRVTDDEATRTARELAKKEGLFAGFSSGANVAAALRLLRGERKGQTIAVLLCDSGLKYLSADLWP